MPTYPTLEPKVIDFSALGNLPQDYAAGVQWRQQQDKINAVKNIPLNPDGSFNYRAAAKNFRDVGDWADASAADQAAYGATQFVPGKDIFGNPDLSRGGFVNLRDRTVTGVQGNPIGQGGQGGQGIGGVDNPDLHGEDFLSASNLPESVKANVRSIARGDQPLPSTNRPLGVQMTGLVNQYDPTFSAATAPSRIATRKAFSVGKQGDAVAALETLGGHLAATSADIDQLGGYDTGIGVLDRTLNTARNWYNRGSSTPAGLALGKIDTDLTAVPAELERVWRGTGGNLGDILQWRQDLDNAATPAQKHAVLQRLATLVQSRVQTLQDQYARGMGTDQYALEIGGKKYDPNTLETEDTANILDALAHGRPLTGATVPKSSQGNAAQIPPPNQRQVGQTYQTPRGPMIWQGNGWQPAQ